MILTGLLLLYPLWWVLGLGVLAFPIAAVPMAVSLLRWRRAGRPIQVPPGFVLWLVFLAVLVLGLAVLDVTPAGTVPGTGMSRLPGAGYRLVGYLSLTVLLLYAGNLTEAELPRRRLVRLLAWLFALTVAGGLLGTFAGHLELTSPVELLLPGELRGNGFIQSLVHPYAAQVMDVGGGDVPRPAAPWGYTNTWGNNVVLLIGWFVAAAWGLSARTGSARTGSAWPGGARTGSARRWPRLLALGTLALASIPIVHSLNRGMWIGLAVVAGWVAVRLALRGRLAALVGGTAVVALLVVALAASPLAGTVQQRLDYGRSDGIRAYLSERAIAGMVESPVIGFGSTRNTQGGRHSIAIGPTHDCEQCGNFTIGGSGQLWQLLFAHGLLGTVSYLGFFGYALWRFRRDRSAIGLAATGAIVGSFVSALWYNALVTPLAIVLLSYALLWRNDRLAVTGSAVERSTRDPAAAGPAAATLSPAGAPTGDRGWR